MKKTSEVKSKFYVKSTEPTESIEVVESYEMSNDFKQNICLPYFKDLHKVGLSIYCIGYEATFRLPRERSK